MTRHQNIQLSVNVNKIALIRNSREGDNPNLTNFSQQILEAGANGITVHPRPDQRHIRPEDCDALSALIRQKKAQRPTLEFNIEGNPFAEFTPTRRPDFSDYPGFMAIIERCQPDQVTLVPDSDQQLTSDHGFDLSGDTAQLNACITILKSWGCRVSLFMDADPEQIKRVAETGADRIELYTGPFAHAHATATAVDAVFAKHCEAAEAAHASGLGVNAGHDLNLQNLALYKSLPHLAEVSIGHAFTIDALHYGLSETVSQYLTALR